ncbi:MAG: PEP-CTERM sorting domain-containing protein [Verrucomicrobiales bacterium]
MGELLMGSLMKREFVFCAAPVLLLSSVASGAIISNFSRTEVAEATGAYDISAMGSADWAVWDIASDTTSATLAPSDERLASTIIQNLTAVAGDGTLRGTSSGATTKADFSWTDGTNDLVGGVANVVGIFNADLDSDGAGVNLNFVLPTLETYEVSVWLGVYNGDADLSLSLGAETLNDSWDPGTSGFSPKRTALYTFHVTPDAPMDVLSLSYALEDDGTANSSHVLLGAAAIRVVPEPGALGLLVMGALIGVRRRRS